MDPIANSNADTNRRTSVLLAANAKPGVGGQGLNLKHMMEGYRGLDSVDLKTFCQGQLDGFETNEVGVSPFLQFCVRTPGFRRLRGLYVQAGETYFDKSVAGAIGKSDYFQGVTGQCLRSLRKASQAGARTRLDVITTHAEVYHREQVRECVEFGIDPTMSQSHLRKTLEEYNVADEIRVMSDVVRNMFLERGFHGDRVFTARPPLDWDQIPSEPHVLQRFPERFTVAFAGLLEPAKGFHYLVRAFGKLNDRDAELHLWGSPGSRPVTDFMDKAIGADPRISMKTGSIRQLGYGNVYGACSVLVHPSLADGFGYVVAEAMACGRPVIVTENTGAADLVSDGENGFIVPIRDTDAILEKLEYLQKNPEMCQKMGALARKSAENLTFENFRRKIGHGL